jgi:hypothetical protein
VRVASGQQLKVNRAGGKVSYAAVSKLASGLLMNNLQLINARWVLNW